MSATKTPSRQKPSKPETFRAFVSRVAPKYRWFKHCEVLADVLQRVADGDLKRVMIFMPPRHGKSEQVSRLFAAYFLYRYPDRWVGINSYAAELAFTLSRSARENYIAGGGSVKEDARAVKHWETGKGGGMWAAGVGGPITGKGFHLGIIDDPIKNAEEAASDTIQQRNQDWYNSTFYTREEPWADDDPNGAIIVIQTRWNEADLSGLLLSQESEGDEPEGWHVVNFPAIAEAEQDRQTFPDTCTVEPDWREEGEALCPERRPISKLKKIAERIGSYFFGALFGQRPTAKEGSFFKVSRLEIVDTLPAGLQSCRAWDMASTAGSGNYTAGVKVAGPDRGGSYYVVDVVRGQWATDDRNRMIRQTAEMDGRTVKIHGPQDPGAAGKDSKVALEKLLAGFPIRVEPVSGSKETRADPWSSQINAGNVKLLRGFWNKDFVEEYRQFPSGKNDDQVDAGADAFTELTTTRGPAGAGVAGGQRAMIGMPQTRR